MGSELFDRLVADLAARLDDPVMRDANVISWGSPIPAFGNLSSAKIATVGLNPSNNEFVDRDGFELSGGKRRFHTLESLGLDRWSDMKRSHVIRLIDSYTNYFRHNPYDSWFAQLDFIISGSRSTFYGLESNACHLDLIPYATECKWTSLTSNQKSLLFEQSDSVIADCINASDVELLILNGQSVVDAFETRFGIDFVMTEIDGWRLHRKNGRDVKGYAYLGQSKHLSAKSLDRTVQILGFNHNLQSSFGITKKVRSSIRNWVATQSGVSRL